MRGFVSFRKSVPVVLAAIMMIFGLAGTALAQSTPTSTVKLPANLAPPDGSVLFFELAAKGFQIYTCEAKPDDATAYAWTFKTPEADLLNSRGEVVGHHFGGPTWQGTDGSSVIAAAVERADAPAAGAIPWLLLAAKDHAGPGVFASVTYVQRLNTVGGIAPVDGCDASQVGAEARQPYQATYAFFYPAGSTRQ